MITLCGILEAGYEDGIEHRIWRQLRGAYKVNLALVPHDYESMEAALRTVRGHRVFLIPPGRVQSVELKAFRPPEHVVYVFGRPGENLVRYIRDGDSVISIETPGNSDMMAVTVAGIVLNECRQ